ncbi:MAG: heavy metal translocating P-type ATPase [Bacillota bacterium]
MQNQIFPVRGLHCASCAQIVKSRLERLPGVDKAKVNYGTEEASVSYDPAKIGLESMNAELQKFGYALVQEQPATQSVNNTAAEEEADLEEIKDNEGAHFAVPLAVFVFLLMIYQLLSENLGLPLIPLPMKIMDVFLLLSASAVIFGPGRRFLSSLLRFFRYGAANMDTLVGLGTGTAYFYSLIIFLFPEITNNLGLQTHYFFDAAIVVIGFIILGKRLEKNAKAKSGAAIRALMSLRPDRAILQKNEETEEIAASEIRIGDRLIVKPGMKIPADGEVVDGSSSVDESMISGEALPVDKKPGDKVIGGSLNRQGLLIIKAEKIGADTVLAHIISLVREAQNSRSPLQNLSDRISSVFVPIVLGISLLSFFLWLLFGPGAIGWEGAISGAISALVGVLVIACPCALGLATPTALMAAIGRGAKEGILIKNAEALEKLRQTNIVIVDKTGTITSGKITVTGINAIGKSETDILLTAAALEQYSEHPLADAIVAKAKEAGLPFRSQLVAGFKATSGHGVSGRVNDDNITLGKAGESLGPWALSRNDSGETIIDVRSSDKLIGQIACGDVIKPEAAEAVAQLKRQKIRVMMLTGDHAASAARIAKLAGIEEVRANMLPEGKAAVIKELQARGHRVAMLGDGINDAPSLAQADSGIAMATGTDTAMATAGITVIGGDLGKAVRAFHLSRLTYRTIKQNLFWAFIYNLIGIPLAAGLFFPLFGFVLNPAFAGAAMAMSSVSVVANSLRLRSKRL